MMINHSNDKQRNLNEEKVNINDKNNKDKQTLKKAPKNAEEFSKLEDGKYVTEKGYVLTIKDNKAYIEGNLIANKTYSLPSDYKPQNPYNNITSERCNNCLEKNVMQAFNEMQEDASASGLNVYISSGYRSYNYQKGLYDKYSLQNGTKEADKYSARAGYSEHQTGLCFDLNTITENFATTPEGKWINQNAHLYGFIIRYPKGKEKDTGYQYEPWHLRYVGKDLAGKLYQNGNWITLEEYYGITSSY